MINGRNKTDVLLYIGTFCQQALELIGYASDAAAAVAANTDPCPSQAPLPVADGKFAKESPAELFPVTALDGEESGAACVRSVDVHQDALTANDRRSGGDSCCFRRGFNHNRTINMPVESSAHPNAFEVITSFSRPAPCADANCSTF